MVKRHSEKITPAIFAVSGIANAIKYYEIFKKKKDAGEHDLRIATIFTYGANEEDEDAQDYLPGDELTTAQAVIQSCLYFQSHER